MTTTPTLPTAPVSADERALFRALATAERNNRVLADVLWNLADENGCYCAVKGPMHSRRCSDARSALLLALESK